MTRFTTVLERPVLAEADLPALSDSSGIPLERLQAINNGHEEPSIYELGEIAEAVGESPSYLIRSQPAIVARRDSGVDHAPMDQLLEAFDRHVSAFRKELAQESPPSFPVTTSWRARSAGEQWAALHDLTWSGDGDSDPLIEVIEQELRIPVLIYPVEGAPFGATLLLNGTVAIWINSHGVAGSQQRFTLAHELGHVLLRHMDVTRVESVRSPEEAPNVGTELQRRREGQANAYAGGVLYDRERVHQHWDRERSPVGLARIAAGLGISYEAAVVAAKVHLKDEMPDVEALARTLAPAQAFRAAGAGAYVDWYEDMRNTERLPHILERADLLDQALRRHTNG